MNTAENTYDVVISCTQTQRAIAEGICIALQQMGISAYYYRYTQEETLGKHLIPQLKALYEKKGTLAVAILTKAYFASKYTMVEYAAIQQRLQHEPDYLIPVRYEAVEMPAVLQELTYLDWENSDVKSLAMLIKKRLATKVNTQLKSDMETIETLPKSILQDTIKSCQAFKNREDAELQYRLGLYYYALNQSDHDLQQAISCFTKAISYDPSSHQSYYWLCRSTITLKGLSKIRYAEMKAPVDWLCKAMQLAPSNPTYLNFAAYLYTQYFKRHGLQNPFKHRPR